ncbi:MAG: bifunctional oligoribonuclease/PAP phosphatase NrnA [Candidatus Omnitrophota bacterium]|nr:bifunctional oligoribonuclease/PAP phosphatase NrnA [Candidatus Omnitrophota bacterium]
MRKNSNTSLKTFCQALKRYDRFLLSCHVTPEGDAIGSMLAMDSLLHRLGKQTTVVCQDEFPKRLPCLSDKRWKQVEEVRKPLGHYQALVVTDCPTIERIGKVRTLLTPETVIFNIDHHISNLYYGHYNYVRPEGSATAEVVVDIFKGLKQKPTKEDALNLYVGITTDTGSFKYSNTTVRSHQVAAELIKTGIDIAKINDQLYSTYSLNKINLLSRLFSRVRTTANGAVAWVEMRNQDLVHSGATYEDAEGFIDYLRYMKEVQIAFFMIEMPKSKTVRVSFRAKGDYDVNNIATCFDGGGHKKASGCVVSGSLKDVEREILQRVRLELKTPQK